MLSVRDNNTKGASSRQTKGGGMYKHGVSKMVHFTIMMGFIHVP